MALLRETEDAGQEDGEQRSPVAPWVWAGPCDTHVCQGPGTVSLCHPREHRALRVLTGTFGVKSWTPDPLWLLFLPGWGWSEAASSVPFSEESLFPSQEEDLLNDVCREVVERWSDSQVVDAKEEKEGRVLCPVWGAEPWG